MKIEFAQWLVDEELITDKKQVHDCVSRVKKVERAFEKYDVSIDREFDRDGCLDVLKCITAEGHNPERAKYPDLDLPFESPSRQMNIIANAFKKYVLFRMVTERKHEELSRERIMARVIANYEKRKNQYTEVLPFQELSII